jgi:hypothetical protein
MNEPEIIQTLFPFQLSSESFKTSKRKSTGNYLMFLCVINFYTVSPQFILTAKTDKERDSSGEKLSLSFFIGWWLGVKMVGS